MVLDAENRRTCWQVVSRKLCVSLDSSVKAAGGAALLCAVTAISMAMPANNDR